MISYKGDGIIDSVKVKIIWLKSEECGKVQIPSGVKYSTVAKFEDIKDKWPQEAWSIVAELENPHDNYVSICNFGFLVEWAPVELLYQGSKFELYEGSKIVAKGDVI